MGGNDWRDPNHPCFRLRGLEQHASLRKIRLLAAAFVRWLEQQPEYANAKRCADWVEEVADSPELAAVARDRLVAVPGDWRLTQILGMDFAVQTAMTLRKLVAFAPGYLGREVPNSHDECFHRADELIAEVLGPMDEPIPVAPEWRTPTAVSLASAIYADRAFDRLPVLADALEEAGCDHPDVLAHCRGPGPHVRGCWVVDLVLGKS